MRKLLLIIPVLFLQTTINCTNNDDPDQVLVHFSSRLTGALVRHDDDEKMFYIFHRGKEVEVQNCFVDRLVRNCSNEFLLSFFENNGYLIVNQFDDGEPYIKAKMRLNGGIVILPFVAAWAIGTVGGIALVRIGDLIDDFLYENIAKRKQIFINKTAIAVSKIDADYKDLTKNSKKPTITCGPCFPTNDPLEKECIVGPGLPHAPHIPHIKLPPKKSGRGHGPHGRPLIGETILV